MVGLEEGLLPHRRSVADSESTIDEPRRLCYVGVTRAQRRLTLTLALARHKWGKARPTLPSRFLYEITGKADNPNCPPAKQKRTGGLSTSRLGDRGRRGRLVSAPAPSEPCVRFSRTRLSG